MRVRRKKRTKRLIVLLSLLLLGIVGFRNILPNLGDVFQYHHVASGEYGWNLILVNRDNYIPDDYTVELTELSNGQKVEYVSSNRWHFFLFIDVSLFLLFSDNSPCTSFAHFYLF